jgi:hypothetical protein
MRAMHCARASRKNRLREEKSSQVALELLPKKYAGRKK